MDLVDTYCDELIELLAALDFGHDSVYMKASMEQGQLAAQMGVIEVSNAESIDHKGQNHVPWVKMFVCLDFKNDGALKEKLEKRCSMGAATQQKEVNCLEVRK